MKIFRNSLLVILASVVFAGCNPLELRMKAGLQVMTGDLQASLFLDNEYLDKTPYINKKIQPGTYNLKIQPDSADLVSFETPIVLNKGVITVITWKPGKTSETSGGVIYEVEKLKNSRETVLEFKTVPDNAIIHFDNEVKQFTPLTLNEIEDSNHDFEISLPSYETQKHSVKALKGHKITITVMLGKATDVPGGEEEAPPAANLTEDPKATSNASKKLDGPQVQIISTNFFVDDEEVLRVRSKASPAGGELGFAKVGESYPYLDDKQGWFQIEFEGEEGWISSTYSQKLATDSAETKDTELD